MALTLNGTTGLSGIVGSAGTPALQGSDTNTGYYFGTDILGLSTGGTERLRITSAGALQLSDTNSPNDKNTDIWVADDVLNFNAFGTNGAFLFKSGSSSTPRLHITSDGKIDLNAAAAKIGNSAGSTATTYLFAKDLRFVNEDITATHAIIDTNGLHLDTTSPTANNGLNDYEEGTWTPTIIQGISSQSYSIQSGHYIKIGHKVHLDFYIKVDQANANAVHYRLGSFPFPIKGANHIRGGGCSTYWNLHVDSSYGTHAQVVAFYGVADGTAAELYQGDVGCKGTNGTSNNDTYLIGFFEYITDG